MIATDWIKYENDKNFKTESLQCLPNPKRESVQPLQGF